MRQVLLVLTMLLAVGFFVGARGENKQGMKTSSRVLVAYFSATGTTAGVAEKLASATGGELLAIQPEKAYTEADLDWRNEKSRSSVEMKDPKARPALKGAVRDLAGYEVVFIGYPIWWDAAPRVINTFIESHDLKGKRLIPFATSGSSGIEESVKALRKSYPDLDWSDGRLLNRASDKTVQGWVDQLGL